MSSSWHNRPQKCMLSLQKIALSSEYSCAVLLICCMLVDMMIEIVWQDSCTRRMLNSKMFPTNKEVILGLPTHPTKYMLHSLAFWMCLMNSIMSKLKKDMQNDVMTHMHACYNNDRLSYSSETSFTLSQHSSCKTWNYITEHKL